MAHWGVADPAVHRGGLTEKKPRAPAREVYLLQRKTTAIGKDLGKTSGWVHRLVAQGLRRRAGQRASPTTGSTTPACTSPSTASRRRCSTSTTSSSAPGRSRCATCTTSSPAPSRPAVHLIGGADVAAELDAKRAIKQGTELAARL